MSTVSDDEKDEIRAFISSHSPTQTEIEERYTGKPDHIRFALYILKNRKAAEVKDTAKADRPVWRQIFKHDDDFTRFYDITPVDGPYSHCFKVNAAPADQIMFIKILRKTERSDNAMEVAKVLKEYRNYNLLRDDNIVSVYNAGWVQTENGDEFPFIATEFLDGHDLSHWREKRGATCGWKETTEIVKSIAATLQRVLNVDKKKVEKIFGKSGISEVMHLDLKPNNVMIVLQKCDKTGEEKEIIKLVDFASGGTAEFATAHGNDQYKAPERFLSRDIRPKPDRSWDIFSLGCLIVYLMTGKHPKSSNCSKAEWNDYLSSLDISNADLKRICQKCLAYNSSERYERPGDVAADLDALLTDHPLPIVRKGEYTRKEELQLLRKRTREQENIADHQQTIGRGSLLLTFAPLWLILSFYFLVSIGVEPSVAFFRSNIVAVVSMGALLARMAYAVNFRHGSLKIIEPLFAMLLGMGIIMHFLCPDVWNTRFPNFIEINRGAPYAMMILALTWISFAANSPEWSIVRPIGWGTLFLVIILRPIFETQTGAMLMPLVIGVLEIAGCLAVGYMIRDSSSTPLISFNKKVSDKKTLTPAQVAT